MSNYNRIFEELINVISEKVADNINKEIKPITITEEEIPVNVDGISKFVDLAVPTIYGLVHQKKIPHYKKSGRLYFLKSEILDWIKSGKQETKSELENRADEYLSKNRLF
jgi:predicted DNA-binding transcriptional regulator AlpA